MSEQPKNFGFGDDEAMLRDSARKFFGDHASADKLHRQVAHNPDIHRSVECIWDQALWKQITELGWTAAWVPDGGRSPATSAEWGYPTISWNVITLFLRIIFV